MEIRARNVNDAISTALWNLKAAGVKESSRNGPVVAYPEPFMTTYTKPQERVLFWPERDQNCYFTLFESLWMLAGRCDVEFVKQFNSKISDYSDDGYSFNAAYGYRWREQFGVDQLRALISLLRREPGTRRAVLQIWDARDLLNPGSKDHACNTQAYFDCRGGKLNMTVTNRSNDLIWGCYGANAVQFSMLQEFVAVATNLPMGVYRQFSNNLHLYTEKHGKWLNCPPSALAYDYYTLGEVVPHPLYKALSAEQFLEECGKFCESPESGYASKARFIRHVAFPLFDSWQTRKAGGSGLAPLESCAAGDWKLAAQQWIQRRENAQ